MSSRLIIKRVGKRHAQPHGISTLKRRDRRQIERQLLPPPPSVIPQDSENSQHPIPDPDRNGNVTIHNLWQRVNVEMPPNTRHKENNEKLVHRQEKLVVCVSHWGG
jgi:hypothetical protein